MEEGKFNLEDDAAVQDFYEKVVMFTSMARSIAAVAANTTQESFGKPCEEPSVLNEPFHCTFNESQIYLARWLAANEYPADPNNCKGLELGNLTPPRPIRGSYTKGCLLGGRILNDGMVGHSQLNMFAGGSDLFRECMAEARRLKENPNDSEAHEAFTEAMKKFMYVWSQSSTCYRGQAAMLMMFVDSMAKYAGCEFQRPEVPEVAKTTLKQLSERFPDRGKVEGSETENGYTSRKIIREYRNDQVFREIVNDFNRKNDEKFLRDLYYHFDVFALHMPSFATFSERYPCTFVPIGENQNPTA
jgi:hypothetical protein